MDGFLPLDDLRLECGQIGLKLSELGLFFEVLGDGVGLENNLRVGRRVETEIGEPALLFLEDGLEFLVKALLELFAVVDLGGELLTLFTVVGVLVLQLLHLLEEGAAGIGLVLAAVVQVDIEDPDHPEDDGDRA